VKPDPTTRPETRTPIVGAPTIRDALRVVFSRQGVIEWISPGRKRFLRWSLFGGGFVTGTLLALLAVRLPEGSLDAVSILLAALIVVVVVAVYLAHDVTMGLELLEKRQVESDLALARQIQQRMLPNELPEIDGYSMGVYHEPARSVGGDAYDVLRLGDDRVFFAVTDVSGKGTAAAVLMSGVLARTRALARTGMHLDELVQRLSAALVEETETVHFAAMVFAVLDPRSGILHYVNAGNQPPVLLRRDGSRMELEGAGLPVGLLPAVTYQAGRAYLGPGDRLAVVTDGIFDADDAGGTLLQESELDDLVRSGDDAGEAVAAIRRRARARSIEGQFDDITVLVLSRSV